MLLRTHLAITLFFVLLFISSLENKILFVAVAIMSTYLPDIDSRYSRIGRRRIARILQWLTKHRGLIHSFTFLFAITLLLVLFFPVVAFGFFLGYGFHLIADSFTRDGIRPFYPSKKRAFWKIKTGGKTEILLFLILIGVDLILIITKLMKF